MAESAAAAADLKKRRGSWRALTWRRGRRRRHECRVLHCYCLLAPHCVVGDVEPFGGGLLAAFDHRAAAVHAALVKSALGAQTPEEDCSSPGGGQAASKPAPGGVAQPHQLAGALGPPPAALSPMLERAARGAAQAGQAEPPPASPLRGRTARPSMAHSVNPAASVCSGGGFTLGNTAAGGGSSSSRNKAKK